MMCRSRSASLFTEVTGPATAKVAEYSYYPGWDRPHAVITGTTPNFAHTDGLGNVIALTDSATQSVRRNYFYDTWGQGTGGGDPGGFAGADRARFKGALWLGPEVELYYMRARWYEPKSGRFLSEDPIGLEGGINLYAYTGGDPVNFRDPFGLDPEPQCPPGSEVVETHRIERNGVQADATRCRDESGEEYLWLSNILVIWNFDDPIDVWASDDRDFWQKLGDVSAGFGDLWTFGGTRAVREYLLDCSDCVTYGSNQYLAGEAAGLVSGFAIGAGLRFKYAYHTKPHPFWYLGGAKLPHHQINIWIPGASGSGTVFRLPLPR